MYLANIIGRSGQVEIFSSMKSQEVLDIAFCPLAHFMSKVKTVLRPWFIYEFSRYFSVFIDCDRACTSVQEQLDAVPDRLNFYIMKALSRVLGFKLQPSFVDIDLCCIYQWRVTSPVTAISRCSILDQISDMGFLARPCGI